MMKKNKCLSKYMQYGSDFCSNMCWEYQSSQVFLGAGIGTLQPDHCDLLEY